MSSSRECVPIYLRTHFDIAEWIEKFDRQVEFFHEEFSGINHGSPTASEIDALRRLPTLLCPIILDSLRHLLV